MINSILRTVTSLMGRFGGDAVMVVDTGQGSYDPETSTTTPSTKEYKVRVIAEDYILKQSGIKTGSGDMIQTGDKQFFIQVSPGVPAPRPGIDYMIFQGKRWNLAILKDYNTSGTQSYLYEVYAKL